VTSTSVEGHEEELYEYMRWGKKIFMNMIINMDSEYLETIPVQHAYDLDRACKRGRLQGYDLEVFTGFEEDRGRAAGIVRV
jgi:hypothetical protein